MQMHQTGEMQGENDERRRKKIQEIERVKKGDAGERMTREEDTTRAGEGITKESPEAIRKLALGNLDGRILFDSSILNAPIKMRNCFGRRQKPSVSSVFLLLFKCQPTKTNMHAI